jgi:HNH endonuclease
VTNRACICGAVDCQRHRRRDWVQKPRLPGSYGAFHQHNRQILLRRAGCRPGTGVGGACEICGKPGVPGDPLQADHIVAVADGGGDDSRTCGRSTSPSTLAEPASRATRPPNGARTPDNFRIPPSFPYGNLPW